MMSETDDNDVSGDDTPQTVNSGKDAANTASDDVPPPEPPWPPFYFDEWDFLTW